MMLNKLAAPLPQVLDFVGNTKWGVRNRALYACRQCLLIKHIANMSVADVLNQEDGTVKDVYLASDGRQFDLKPIRVELIRYLTARFCLSDKSLEPLSTMNLNVPLFPTQKRDNFTPNTLAQNLSLTDRLVKRYFYTEASKQKLFVH